jgi:hypothetical protein
VQALPQAAYFLLLEAAAGGCIALFWVHLRGEVTRGFTLFTGACLLFVTVLAIWLHLTFPPLAPSLSATAGYWFAAERTLSLALAVLLALYLLTLQRNRPIKALGPVVPLVALAAVWSAALVDPGSQLFGLGTPLAVLLGALALGAALAGLSLGHWYLVSPGLSVQPLVRITFLCLGAIAAQMLLEPLLLFAPRVQSNGLQALFGVYLIFFGVRVIFGLLVPLAATVMTWRTARIRSLDSATGLLYIVVALIFAGEITARTLYYMIGVSL